MRILPKFLAAIFFLIRFSLILFILLTLFGLLAPYIENIRSYPFINSILQFETSINKTIKMYIPTKIAHMDMSRVITIIAILFLLNFVISIWDNIYYKLQHRAMKKEVNHLKQSFSHQAKETLAIIENQMELVKHSHGKDRKKLLKEFAHIKRELEKHGRDMAFLSIDVVDSTGMKMGEDANSVQHDFHEYQEYVQASFKKHGVITASWTPDGVMACFNTIQNAVDAGQDIIQGLDYFNEHVKLIKKDFKVRCGVNGGFVYYDSSIPLENFSDRTIDIAGHMQKYAAPNTLLIARQIIEPAIRPDNFERTDQVVDGLEVYIWKAGEDIKT